MNKCRILVEEMTNDCVIHGFNLVIGHSFQFDLDIYLSSYPYMLANPSSLHRAVMAISPN